MKRIIKKPIRSCLVRALLCSTAALLSQQALAQDAIVIEGPTVINSTVTQGDLGVGPGDTVIINEDVEFNVVDQVGLDFWRLDLDGVNIINNGTIFTDGTIAGPFFGDGIFVSRATNLSVTNNGLISIGDGESYGIYVLDVSDSTVINNGTLITRIDARELVTENGNTALSSGYSGGVRLDSYTATYDASNNVIDAQARLGNLLINNGKILSEVLQSRGLYIDGAVGDFWLFTNATAVNNGEIYMVAAAETGSSGTFDASGMRVEGHGNTLINNGLIEVHPEGFGMDGNGAANTLINNGVIRTYYQNSHGIENYRNGNDRPFGTPQNETYNFSNIEVWGDNTHGVTLSGHQSHRFENSGRIISHQGYSIDVNAAALELFQNPDNPTDPTDLVDTGAIDVVLHDGSVLYGDVFIYFRDRYDPATGTTSREGADRLTTLTLGDGLNATIHFDLYSVVNPINSNVTSGGALPENIRSSHDNYVVDETNGIIYVVDLDSYAQQDQALWRMTSMLQDAIDAGSATQMPANTYGFAKNGNSRWTRAFGGGLFAQRDGSSPAYNAVSGGVITGIERPGQLGFHGGLAVSYVKGNEDVSYETTSASFFGGVSGDLSEDIGYSFTAGIAYNSTDRDQVDNTVSGGIGSDTADYASVFWSPSVRIEGPIEGSSVRLLYTGLWQQGHTFNFPGGTVLSVDDRYANFVQSRFEMKHKVRGVNLAYGVETSWTDGQNTSFDLMGTSLVTPYDDGFSSRFFSRVYNDQGYVEVGYDTDERTTVEAGLKLNF